MKLFLMFSADPRDTWKIIQYTYSIPHWKLPFYWYTLCCFIYESYYLLYILLYIIQLMGPCTDHVDMVSQIWVRFHCLTVLSWFHSQSSVFSPVYYGTSCHKNIYPTHVYILGLSVIFLLSANWSILLIISFSWVVYVFPLSPSHT